MLHNLVAKTFSTTNQARTDTCTEVTFPTTIVIEPNKDEWVKIFHLMKYIRGKIDLPLILSSNDSGILKWWIDTYYAVNPNMQGHTGGGLSMGRVFPIVILTNHKLNIRSSTGSEIVVFHDFIPSV